LNLANRGMQRGLDRGKSHIDHGPVNERHTRAQDGGGQDPRTCLSAAGVWDTCKNRGFIAWGSCCDHDTSIGFLLKAREPAMCSVNVCRVLLTIHPDRTVPRKQGGSLSQCDYARPTVET